MDVSAQTLREVEFREKLRGYHPDDVDQFLEQVAAGIDYLQDRLRQALERAQRAEQRLIEADQGDDALKRTLVLAQRTAELAVQEAREEAARLTAQAQREARAMVSEAEEIARRTIEETQGGLRADVTKLELAREQLRADIAQLEDYLVQERTRLRDALREAAELMEAALPDPTPTPPVQDVDVPVPRVPLVTDWQPASPEAPAPAAEAPEPEPELELSSLTWGPDPTGGEALPEGSAAGSAAGDDAGEPTQAVDVATRAEPEDRLDDDDEEEDPFIAELRRAITDPEPLGPRDEDDEPNAPPGEERLYDQDLIDGTRLGTFLRRRR